MQPRDEGLPFAVILSVANDLRRSLIVNSANNLGAFRIEQLQRFFVVPREQDSSGGQREGFFPQYVKQQFSIYLSDGEAIISKRSTETNPCHAQRNHAGISKACGFCGHA